MVVQKLLVIIFELKCLDKTCSIILVGSSVLSNFSSLAGSNSITSFSSQGSLAVFTILLKSL